MTVFPTPSDAALRKVDTHVSTSLRHNHDELDAIDFAAWADRAADVTRLVGRKIKRWATVAAPWKSITDDQRKAKALTQVLGLIISCGADDALPVTMALQQAHVTEP